MAIWRDKNIILQRYLTIADIYLNRFFLKKVIFVFKCHWLFSLDVSKYMSPCSFEKYTKYSEEKKVLYHEEWTNSWAIEKFY